MSDNDDEDDMGVAAVGEGGGPAAAAAAGAGDDENNDDDDAVCEAAVGEGGGPAAADDADAGEKCAYSSADDDADKDEDKDDDEIDNLGLGWTCPYACVQCHHNAAVTTMTCGCRVCQQCFDASTPADAERCQHRWQSIQPHSMVTARLVLAHQAQEEG